MAKQKSALELAKKIADDKLKKALVLKKKAQEDADIEKSNKEHFLKTMQDVIEQFDGIKGIKVVKSKGVGDSFEWILTQKKENIVKVTFGWKEWQETNYDDSTSWERGHTAEIETYPGYRKGAYYDSPFCSNEKRGSITSIHYSSDFEKRFANIMSEFL